MTSKAWAFVVGIILFVLITWPWLWKLLPIVAAVYIAWLFLSGRVISKATRERMERENGN